MTSTALMVAFLAGAGLGAVPAQAHDTRTPSLGLAHADSAGRQDCMRGYVWDARLMRCVRTPPRGSY